MITLSTPLLLEMSIMVLRAGMSDSHPSRPNRFSEDHFFCRNSSNLWKGGSAVASQLGSEHLSPPKTQTSTNLQILWIFSSWLLRCVVESEEPQTDLVDLIILAKRILFSSWLNCMIPGVSNFFLIHWHCSMSLMNINSTPICWQ